MTASFRFDAAVSNQHQFDPYVDTYGQAVYGTWPSKVSADSDLQAAVPEEQTWFANNGPPGGMDIYGGSTLAGWTDKATGYYHTAFHSNRWYLISPLGNPLFYIGLTAVFPAVTPITGRESIFQLPPQTGDFAAAYSQNANGDTQNTTYVSFDVANQVRKYGSKWSQMQDMLLGQRLAGWLFAGAGKFGHTPAGFPVDSVLKHDAVSNIVTGGHPDIFDPGIVGQLKSTLMTQILPDATTASIIGWGVGNEKDEIILTSEVQAILDLGASVPAKKALVDHALSAIYGGSVSALAAVWKIAASTVADVYASKPTPPSDPVSLAAYNQDLETLRQYYERDFADRAIAATARVHRLRLVTSDQRTIESNLVPVVE